ncbi:MAG: DUF3775 domain-containing protein [Pseudomonadota bacterium]
MTEISLSADFLEWFIVKAREFEVKDAATGAADDDDPTGSVLEDRGDDPVEYELTQAIDDLNDRQQAEFVALVWTGRGVEEGSDPEDFETLVALASSERTNKTSAYLLGMPLLPDYVIEGAKALGVDVDI